MRIILPYLTECYADKYIKDCGAFRYNGKRGHISTSDSLIVPDVLYEQTNTYGTPAR